MYDGLTIFTAYILGQLLGVRSGATIADEAMLGGYTFMLLMIMPHGMQLTRLLKPCTTSDCQSGSMSE